MLRKICPICEQTMKLSHYCRNCRQFVKTPYVRDVTYYLNERHPEKEMNCDYHGLHGQKEETISENARPAVNIPVYSPSEKKQKTSVNIGKKGVIYVFLGTVILIQVIGAFKSLITDYYTPVNYDAADEYRQMSDEEVRDVGIVCTSNGHYSISGSSMADEMEGIIEKAGYEIDGAETFSWNYVGTGEDNFWTDYETTIEYYVYLAGNEQENVEMDSVMVNYDTATGQLHEITLCTSGPETGAFMAGEILEFLQEQGEIGEDEEYGELAKGRILAYSDGGEDEEKEGEWMDIPKEGQGQTVVYFHEMDGMFYVGIWKEQEWD